MRVLLVEDEVMLREGLVDLFEGAGHEVVAVGDGESAVDIGVRHAFDMAVLDLMLPKLDGLEVCRRLRLARPTLPVLMLTAKGGENDKVDGLRSGADDYMTKPFSPRELLARLEVFERRLKAAPRPPEVFRVASAGFDLSRGVVVLDGRAEEPLTAREVGIVRWLHLHRGRAVTRSELLEHVWGVSPHVETRTVDVTIANLRKKVETDPKHPSVIVSMKGVGYALGDAGEEPGGA